MVWRPRGTCGTWLSFRGLRKRPLLKPFCPWVSPTVKCKEPVAHSFGVRAARSCVKVIVASTLQMDRLAVTEPVAGIKRPVTSSSQHPSELPPCFPCQAKSVLDSPSVAALPDILPASPGAPWRQGLARLYLWRVIFSSVTCAQVCLPVPGG